MKRLILAALLIFASSAALESCSTPSSGAEQHLAKGYDLQRAGQWQQAISELTKAIELDPNLASAYSYRGECYDALGQYDQAPFERRRARLFRSVQPLVETQ